MPSSLQGVQMLSGNGWEGLNMYGRICPLCGANLDPDEKCDCQEKEEVASSGANTESDKGNISTNSISEPSGTVNG